MDELVKRLRSLKVLLGTDSPEVRGWSSAVQQAAQKTVNDAIAALSAQPQGRCVAPPCKCDASNQQRCAYWQEAQPQQEPVAWSVFADNGNIRLWTADCSMKKTYEAIHGPMTPLYTAPPSGVREGMLRAAEICKRPKPDCCGRFESDDNSMNLVCCGKLEPGEFMDGLECSEAITRAADQVNAEGQKIICHAAGDRCHGCDHYKGLSAVCKFAPSAPHSEQTHVAVAESHCVWMQDSDGPWNTSCGHVFEFTDGGPHQNYAAWCQYCGGKLLPQYHDAEQESVECNAAMLRAATGKEGE